MIVARNSIATVTIAGNGCCLREHMTVAQTTTEHWERWSMGAFALHLCNHTGCATQSSASAFTSAAASRLLNCVSSSEHSTCRSASVLSAGNKCSRKGQTDRLSPGSTPCAISTSLADLHPTLVQGSTCHEAYVAGHFAGIPVEQGSGNGPGHRSSPLLFRLATPTRLVLTTAAWAACMRHHQHGGSRPTHS